MAKQPITASLELTAGSKEGTRHWSETKTKGYRIALSEYADGTWEVYALDGHELLPVTREFKGTTAEADARAWANNVWARY